MLTYVDTSFYLSKLYPQHWTTLGQDGDEVHPGIMVGPGKRDMKRHLQTLAMGLWQIGNSPGPGYPQVMLKGNLLREKLETRYPVCLTLRREPKQSFNSSKLGAQTKWKKKLQKFI